jgi:hypothetical protein
MIVGILLMAVLAVVGGFYYWCFWKTVCMMNSSLKIANHTYRIDRQAVIKLVERYKPEKRVKTVGLWVKPDQIGHNKRQQVANKPVVVEIKFGREGKNLMQEVGKEPKITVLGEDHGWFIKIMLFVNPEYAEQLWEMDVNRALAEALRFHVGTKNWDGLEGVQLIREVLP